MVRALQQGEADGLCGLYAILNFLKTTNWWPETRSQGLWYVLEACRHFGWLTPQMLTEGFDDCHLKAILDYQIDNYRLEFETHYLSDVSLQYPECGLREIADRVVAKKGAMILLTKAGGHWVLVRGYKNRPAVWDSSAADPAPKPLAKRQLDEELGWGIVILPSPRALQQVEI